MKREKQVYVPITLDVMEVQMERGYAASANDFESENDNDWV